MTELELLRAARQLLVEKGWTQWTGARDAAGNCTSYLCPEAVCFCPIGALERALWNVRCHDRSVIQQAVKHLNARVKERDIADFNDVKGRTLAEVLAVFDRAIAKLEMATQLPLAEVTS